MWVMIFLSSFVDVMESFNDLCGGSTSAWLFSSFLLCRTSFVKQSMAI